MILENNIIKTQRSFLFLQGPVTNFFKELGKALLAQGCQVHKINMNGGDLITWCDKHIINFRQSQEYFPTFIAECFDKYAVTDLILVGDWRPVHKESIYIARSKNIKVWVFEEGYLRPNFVTLEENGVNAYSPLSKNADDIRNLAQSLPSELPYKLSDTPHPMSLRVRKTIKYYFGIIVFYPLFLKYNPHRPDNFWLEAYGYVKKYLTSFIKNGQENVSLNEFYTLNRKFYFFPLQIDADSQIRYHSPFRRLFEAICYVIENFANNAPKDTFLVIKNHPLDNSLFNYKKYVNSLAKVYNCQDRIYFFDHGNTNTLIEKSLGVVLLNSTVGLTALQANKPLYALGNAIYNIQGLATNRNIMPLADFWTKLPEIDNNLLNDFIKVIKHNSLISGNFFQEDAIKDATKAALNRFHIRASAYDEGMITSKVKSKDEDV